MNYPPGAAVQVCLFSGNPVSNHNVRGDLTEEWFRCRNGTDAGRGFRTQIYDKIGISRVCATIQYGDSVHTI